MGKFTYVARDTKGARIEGSLEVDDRQAVVARLQTMGFFPVEVEEVRSGSMGRFSLAALRGRVKASDLVNFNRQLADLVGAGVPLAKSLTIIMNQTPGELMREIVADIRKNVEGGDTLAGAMERHSKAFSPLNIAMVGAGETAGMLHDVLERLADYSEAEEDLKGKVVSSLAYPIIMVLAGIVVISILVTVVIPRIVGVYESLQQTLPLVTQILIASTEIIGSYWWVLVIAVAALIAGLRGFAKTEEGRTFFHALVLRIPVVGEVIHKRELSRFARTLGNLLRNGVPILAALQITENVMTNTIVRREVRKVPIAISQGSSMAATLGDSSLFPDVMVSMISVGEETAQLDRVLLRVSDTYEAQVDRSLKMLTSMLEPLIILALGLVVGFIVIAMMLPIMGLDPTGGE